MRTLHRVLFIKRVLTMKRVLMMKRVLFIMKRVLFIMKRVCFCVLAIFGNLSAHLSRLVVTIFFAMLSIVVMVLTMKRVWVAFIRVMMVTVLTMKWV